MTLPTNPSDNLVFPPFLLPSQTALPYFFFLSGSFLKDSANMPYAVELGEELNAGKAELSSTVRGKGGGKSVTAFLERNNF